MKLQTSFTSDDMRFVIVIDMEIRSPTIRDRFGKYRIQFSWIQVQRRIRISNANDPFSKFQEPQYERSSQETSPTNDHTSTRALVDHHGNSDQEICLTKLMVAETVKFIGWFINGALLFGAEIRKNVYNLYYSITFTPIILYSKLERRQVSPLLESFSAVLTIPLRFSEVAVRPSGRCPRRPLPLKHISLGIISINFAVLLFYLSLCVSRSTLELSFTVLASEEIFVFLALLL